MRWTLVALAMILPVSSVRTGAVDDDIRRKEELAWARRIVTDFLEGVTATDRERPSRLAGLRGLLTPELAKAMQADAGRWNVFEEFAARHFHHPQISSEELAPNGSEAIFSGTVKGKDGNPDRRFVLRVAKESEHGKWSIRFLRLLPAKETKAAEEKPQRKKPEPSAVPAKTPVVPKVVEPPSSDAGQPATFRSKNFRVTAANQEVAKQIAGAAERHLKAIALLWTGKELPAWSEPCPIDVKTTGGSASGSTAFAFDQGKVLGQQIWLKGSLDHILADGLSHELAHVVFAQHFGCPVPRWADEGASILSEPSAEGKRQIKLLHQILKTPDRRIPLRRLFEMREYPSDVVPLHAQGYSVTRFLVEAKDRKTFLAFVTQGMKQGWDQAAKDQYGYGCVKKLEIAWLNHVKRAPKRPKVRARPSP